MRESIAEILEGEGYSVGCAANGSEALAFLRNAHRLPSLILLDLMMPVMNGWEFREKQQSDATLAEIPVIVLSGDANAAHEANRLRVAASANKPVSIAHLLALVERFSGGVADS
jgi:CheY-like chemotaxis protein